GSPAMNFANVNVSEANGALWAANEGMRIKVPAEIAARLKRYAGKECVLGIRPEDLRVANSADPADLNIEAEVEVVEQLGWEALLDVKAAPTPMGAAADPAVRAKIRDHPRLAMTPERLHFFDSASEAAI